MPAGSSHNLHRARARRHPLRPMLAALLLAGCVPGDAAERAADDGAAPGSPPPTADSSAVARSEERPEEVQGSIVLEGLREPMRYQLFRAPPDFPLQFSTYVPEDMVVERGQAADGAEVRFVANFAGRREPRATLSVLAPPPLNAAQARALLRTAARLQGPVEVVQRPTFAWALEEYRFRGVGGEVGRVALGRNRGRFFLVTVRYPAEMGDGMQPRVRRILDEWRWRGGGALGS